jgi:hypothetical protein
MPKGKSKQPKPTKKKKLKPSNTIKKNVPPGKDEKSTPQDKIEYLGCGMAPNPNKKPGKSSKIKIDCSNYPIIKFNGDDKYDNTDLKPDGQTNIYWDLPSAKVLKNFKKITPGIPEEARALYEWSKPDPQCKNAAHTLVKDQKCYICDIEMKNINDAGFAKKSGSDSNKEGFVRSGRQCEHLIPVLVMAIICGLYSSGIDNITKDFFDEYKKFKPFKAGYIAWRKEMWEYAYRWSHTECNMIKNEYPFIKIKINYDDPGNLVSINDSKGPGRANINIKKLYKCLLRKKDKWCGMYRKTYGKDISNEIAEIEKKPANSGKSPSDIWIEGKYNKLHEKYIQPLAVKIKGVSNPPKSTENPTPKEYFAISILILRKMLFNKLQIADKQSSISKIFKDTDKIMILFDSAKKIYSTSKGGGKHSKDSYESDEEPSKKYRKMPHGLKEGLVEGQRKEIKKLLENIKENEESEEYDEELETNIKKFIRKEKGLIFYSKKDIEEEKKTLHMAVLLTIMRSGGEYDDLLPIFNKQGIYEEEEIRNYLLDNLLLTRVYKSESDEYNYDWSIVPKLFKSELKLLEDDKKFEEEKIYIKSLISAIEEVYENKNDKLSRSKVKNKNKRTMKKKKTKKKKKKKKKTSKK